MHAQNIFATKNKRQPVKKTTANTPALVCETSFRVRFSEVDSMHIVWHGSYALYLEEGREAFGRQFPGLGYGDIASSGYGAPIVDMHVQYRSPLRLGDQLVVETRYIATEAAKICFEYEIRRIDTSVESDAAGSSGVSDAAGVDSRGVLVATATTMQVFTTPAGELELVNPQFYVEWKRRWGVM
jgi:acyl-CoA thioester hydrolase